MTDGEKLTVLDIKARKESNFQVKGKHGPEE